MVVVHLYPSFVRHHPHAPSPSPAPPVLIGSLAGWPVYCKCICRLSGQVNESPTELSMFLFAFRQVVLEERLSQIE